MLVIISLTKKSLAFPVIFCGNMNKMLVIVESADNALIAWSWTCTDNDAVPDVSGSTIEYGILASS